MKALVVPTIRESCIQDFLKVWESQLRDVEVIVIEDNPKKSFSLDSHIHHLAWEDIELALGDDAWIISRRDSAIRSFGFFYAYKLGAQHIFSLDDDCWPVGTDYFGVHLRNLQENERWTSSVSNITPRGMPYFNRGKLDNVVVNMGLWRGVPDLDAVHQLALGTPTDYEPNEQDRIVPSGQYFPFCGMNFCFEAKAAPLMYFPIMGKDSPYGRFDDIWCGVIMKKICDHLNWRVRVGGPIIHHKKASNVLANLVKEAPGIQMNEKFWTFVDRTLLLNHHPIDCMREIGQSIQYGPDADPNKDPYLTKLGEAIQIWANLFTER